MKTALCWDIDGTLLTTGRAGIDALEEAAYRISGTWPDLTGLETAGMIDRRIAADILERTGSSPAPERIDRLLREYGEVLPTTLGRKAGRVLTGVREILDHLHERDDLACLLLTGNIEAGARAKLAHYGLDGYFDQGAFSDRAENRIAIARDALALASALAQAAGCELEQVYVIGDTPHDIACGHAIEARVIAVATGSYSLAELEAHSPWWAIDELPDAEVFVDKLGI